MGDPAGHDSASDLRAALEAAILADPDDLANHMAYADWLSEQGDPRGEFIQVQLALEDQSRSADERKALLRKEGELLNIWERAWLGDLAPFFFPQRRRGDYSARPRCQFARGWLDVIETDWLTESFVAALNAAPLARLLRGLTISGVEADEGVLAPLRESPCLANLRRFQLGLPPEEDQSLYVEGAEEIGPLIRRMPCVEEIRLFVSHVNAAELFAAPMPNLRVLHVYHLTEYPLDILAANATLGRLEELSLWPHALIPGDEAAYITLDGVRALANSPQLGGLRRLDLYLTDMGDEGCAEIVRSGLLKRLEVLDISRGRVSDRGARILADCPDLRHLRRLVIRKNELNQEGIAALRAAGIEVDADEQHSDGRLGGPAYLFDGDIE
jgi:uncharacterized protein (TIGR02996 family)